MIKFSFRKYKLFDPIVKGKDCKSYGEYAGLARGPGDKPVAVFFLGSKNFEDNAKWGHINMDLPQIRKERVLLHQRIFGEFDYKEMEKFARTLKIDTEELRNNPKYTKQLARMLHLDNMAKTNKIRANAIKTDLYLMTNLSNAERQLSRYTKRLARSKQQKIRFNSRSQSVDQLSQPNGMNQRRPSFHLSL